MQSIFAALQYSVNHLSADERANRITLAHEFIENEEYDKAYTY